MPIYAGDTITDIVQTGQTGDTITAAIAQKPSGAAFTFTQEEIGTAGDYRIEIQTVAGEDGWWIFKPQSALNPGDYQTATYDVDPAIGTGGGLVVISPFGGYVTTASFKLRLDINDEKDDTAIAAVIEAASRQIDDYCNRFFYQVAAETRVFTADDSRVLDIDDLVSLSSLATDDTGDRSYGTTWLTTDYDLGPPNAAARGVPYTKIERRWNGNRSFPRSPLGVQVMGTWGWPAVPGPIQEATFLIANRLFKRIDAPFGVLGSAELGQLQVITRIDPDALQLMNPYRRFRVGVV